jgi:hypothetical protein
MCAPRLVPPGAPSSAAATVEGGNVVFTDTRPGSQVRDQDVLLRDVAQIDMRLIEGEDRQANTPMKSLGSTHSS